MEEGSAAKLQKEEDEEESDLDEIIPPVKSKEDK